MTPSDPQSPQPGESSGPGAFRPTPDEFEGRLLDAAHDQLDAREAEAWVRRLASEPSLPRRQAEWTRWVRAFRAAAPEPVEAGLAKRLALRVRDQVGREEHSQRREGVRDTRSLSEGRARTGWSRRTTVRLVFASLGIHVAVLGWIVWNQSPSPAPKTQGPVATHWNGPTERDPSLLGADSSLDGRPLELPRDLGPVVSPEWIPDALLVDHGLPPVESGVLPAPEPNVRVAEHPFEVQFAMLARTRAPVKSARLRRVGLDPDGTALAVDRGLRALASRQDTDGSFPRTESSGGAPGRADLAVAGVSAAGTLDAVGRTGLALLAFLAEGRSSAAAPGAAPDDVVAPGVAWLRRKLAKPALFPGDAPRRIDPVPPSDLALGLLALSEDYMLAYGRWSPAEARSRAEELRALGERLVAMQKDDGSFEGPAADASATLWPLLALDGVRHAGVVLPAGRTRERLERWLSDQPSEAVSVSADALVSAGHLLLASGQGSATTTATIDAATMASTRVLLAADLSGRRGPLTALAASVALYRRAPAAFRDWNRAKGEALRARLSPSGLVTEGDAVADTALVLLALQSAYRAY